MGDRIPGLCPGAACYRSCIQPLSVVLRFLKKSYICTRFQWEMGTLKNKSGLFELAARECRDKNIYISVPHSAYYCCLMFMRHIWIEKLGHSADEFSAAVSQSKKTGSHELLINQIATLLVEYKVVNFAREFTNLVGQLKEIRVEADYSDKNIDIEKAENAIRIMDRLLPLLKKCA